MLKRINVLKHSTKLSTVSVAVCTLLVNSMSAMAQDWCEGKVSHRDNVVVAPMDKPQALQSYTDPAFGTRVTRVTNAPSGTAHRTLYSTVQPWNADESLLMLYHTGGNDSGHHLYDGKTYEYIRAMEFTPADIEEIYWDENDPSALYFVQQRPNNDALHGKLVKYNVDTRKRTLVADLDPICGKPSERGGLTVKGGNDIQGIADNRIGLRCVNDKVNGNSSDITFHVNVRTGSISQSVPLDPAMPQGANTFGFLPDVAASTMRSGERIIIQDSVFDNEMNYLYAIDGSFTNYTKSNGKSYQIPKVEHSTIGQMPNGNDAVYSPRYDPSQNGCDGDSESGQGALVAHDIQSGSCQVVVGMSTGWGYPLSGVHVSAVSSQNPGWVTMTSIGNGQLEYLENRQPAPTLFSELSLTYAEPDDPTTCRIAHVRTEGKSASRGSSYGGGYFGEPHAVMSPSGSRVLFNSDWYDSGSVDTYAVNLGTPETDNQTTLEPVVEPIIVSEPGESTKPTPNAPIYRLMAQVRSQDNTPRVYVDFANTNRGANDLVRIARAGTSDEYFVMWLYTNGTQQLGGSGPSTGRLEFLQQYIGRGEFEARLFVKGNLDQAVERVSFVIP
ncbi:MAG: hypothetical protein AB8B64_16135 [Granulosicoccus sp.]